MYVPAINPCTHVREYWNLASCDQSSSNRFKTSGTHERHETCEIQERLCLGDEQHVVSSEVKGKTEDGHWRWKLGDDVGRRDPIAGLGLLFLRFFLVHALPGGRQPPRSFQMASLQHRRTHNLLLISKLLNQRDAASPFTLVLDSLEQSGKPLLAEYMKRANVGNAICNSSALC